MAQEPRFKPAMLQRHETQVLHSGSGGDNRDGRIYVYHNKDIELAVNVALATHRPLLLSGPSGCGKSSLALNVALTLGWRYYEFVVTTRSEAQDLLWGFDSLSRLNDAQAKELKPKACYVEPGVLWWAFDPATARVRGDTSELLDCGPAVDPSPIEGERAVILIDEIDKADPDFPNNLLVPLGSMQFEVPALQRKVAGRQPPLIFITNNGERELPQAFVRRCISLTLPEPNVDRLVEIAKAHFPKAKDSLLREVAGHVKSLTEGNEDDAVASTAEYLDTLKACEELGLTPGDQDFEVLSEITLRKTSVGRRDPWR